MDLDWLKNLNTDTCYGLLVGSSSYGANPLAPGIYETLSQWLYLKQQYAVGQKNIHCTKHVKTDKKCKLCQKKFNQTFKQQLIRMMGEENYEAAKDKTVVYSRIEKTETGHIFLAPFNRRAKETVEWTLEHACKVIELGAYHRLSHQHFRSQSFPGEGERPIGKYITIEADYG